MVVVNKLNIFTEMSLYLNCVDFLLKTRSPKIFCNFTSIRLFVFFEQIVDFNLVVSCRIFAFCFFIFLINKYPRNLCNSIQGNFAVMGLEGKISNTLSIFDFIWNLYIFYIKRGINVRRKEFVIRNCLVFNIYNLFLFPGFLNCYDELEELRFCSLKVVIMLSMSGVYMRLFLSSFNIRLLC